LLGGFNVTGDELRKLKTLSKKSVTIENKALRKIRAAEDERDRLQSALTTAERDRDIWKRRYNGLHAEVKDFLSAIRNFPQRLLRFIDEHWHERQQEKTKSREVSR